MGGDSRVVHCWHRADVPKHLLEEGTEGGDVWRCLVWGVTEDKRGEMKLPKGQGGGNPLAMKAPSWALVAFEIYTSSLKLKPQNDFCIGCWIRFASGSSGCSWGTQWKGLWVDVGTAEEGLGWKVLGPDLGDPGRADWGPGEGRGGRVSLQIGVA